MLVSRLCVQDGLPAIDTLEDIQRMASYAPGLAWKDNFVQVS